MKTRLGRRGRAIAVVAGMVAAILPARAQDVLGEAGIKGAGSSFAYPVLSKWSRDYRAALARGGDFPTANAGLDDPPASSVLDYEPVGSLAGMLRVKDRAVDFAASDMPLASDDLARLDMVQFPIVMGGVVLATNIDGVGPDALKLTGALVADIFLGKITRWSDSALRAVNPGLTLPDAPIVVVRRSDGSGTTFNFTNYLSKVSPEWKLRVGSAMLVQWPTGASAIGNEGVAKVVKQTRNSVGYVDYAQAQQLKLNFALLQNRAGRFVRPDTTGFQAAAAGADWGKTSDFGVLLTDMPGEHAYPIGMTVFVFMHKSGSPSRTRAALDFFRWSIENGAGAATQVGFVPLPRPLVRQVLKHWTTHLKAAA